MGPQARDVKPECLMVDQMEVMVDMVDRLFFKLMPITIPYCISNFKKSELHKSDDHEKGQINMGSRLKILLFLFLYEP